MRPKPQYLSPCLAAAHDEAIGGASRSRRQLWWVILGLILLSLLLTSLTLVG